MTSTDQTLRVYPTKAKMSTGNHHENHHENHQNSSILLDSLKEFDVELTQRNAAALNDLNRQIDELSEIPIDSSTLPRYLEIYCSSYLTR